MDNIYEEAVCVHICIGDLLQDHSRCMKWLRAGRRKSLTDDLYEHFENLFALQYFRRVWVIQEVGLAK